MRVRFGSLGIVVAATALTGVIAGCAAATTTSPADTPTQSGSVTGEQLISRSHPVISKLPTTLAGYKRAFANLPARTWGGGDVAVTTRLEDGRAVWFFGDTLTRRGGRTWLLRNTALVQAGETLHAANNGTQIIPSDRRGRVVYWPSYVREAGAGMLYVWTSKVRAGKGGPFDFHRVRADQSRVAVVTVDDHGDMHFVGWGGWRANVTGPGAAPADGSDTRVLGPGHWGYQQIVHPELPIAGGHLVTESQNWDDGHRRLLDYRPLLSSRAAER